MHVHITEVRWELGEVGSLVPPCGPASASQVIKSTVLIRGIKERCYYAGCSRILKWFLREKYFSPLSKFLGWKVTFFFFLICAYWTFLIFPFGNCLHFHLPLRRLSFKYASVFESPTFIAVPPPSSTQRRLKEWVQMRNWSCSYCSFLSDSFNFCSYCFVVYRMLISTSIFRLELASLFILKSDKHHLHHHSPEDGAQGLAHARQAPSHWFHPSPTLKPNTWSASSFSHSCFLRVS